MCLAGNPIPTAVEVITAGTITVHRITVVHAEIALTAAVPAETVATAGIAAVHAVTVATAGIAAVHEDIAAAHVATAATAVAVTAVAAVHEAAVDRTAAAEATTAAVITEEDTAKRF